MAKVEEHPLRVEVEQAWQQGGNPARLILVNSVRRGPGSRTARQLGCESVAGCVGVARLESRIWRPARPREGPCCLAVADGRIGSGFFMPMRNRILPGRHITDWWRAGTSSNSIAGRPRSRTPSATRRMGMRLHDWRIRPRNWPAHARRAPDEPKPSWQQRRICAGPTRLESGQACGQLLIPQSQSLRRHLPSPSPGVDLKRPGSSQKMWCNCVDLSGIRAPGESGSFAEGTEGSNPSPSSCESRANLTSSAIQAVSFRFFKEIRSQAWRSIPGTRSFVRMSEPRRMAELIDERKQRAVLVIWGAEIAQPDMLFRLKETCQFRDDPRLARRASSGAAPKTSMLVISHANDGPRLAIPRMLGAAWQRCRYGRYRSVKKNTECEAAHTRYGRMRGILNAMPHAVWRGIGACPEAHHAM